MHRVHLAYDPVRDACAPSPAVPVTEDEADRFAVELRDAAPSDRANVVGEIAAAAQACLDEDTDRYETLVARIALRAAVPESLLVGLLEREQDPQVRFLCFAMLFTLLRRRRARRRTRDLIAAHRGEFGPRALFQHFEAMSHAGGSVGELRRGLAAAERAVTALPGTPGPLHTCAVFLADLVSAGGSDNPEADLQRAMQLVDEAIDKSWGRARFFHTRARLLRMRGDFDAAHAEIVKAIDQEDPDVVDFQERIAVYLIEKSTIEAERAIRQVYLTNSRDLRQAFDERVRQIQGTQTRLIEAVAFIAAALAIVQATMQETMAHAERRRSVWEVVLLIGTLGVVLFGAVLLTAYLLRRVDRTGERDDDGGEARRPARLRNPWFARMVSRSSGGKVMVTGEGRIAPVEFGRWSMQSETLALPAPGKDQDALLLTERVAVVADGATPLDGHGVADVRRFAGDVVRALADRAGTPLRDAVTDTIRVLGRGGGDPWSVPSCTLAAVRVDGPSLEVGVLGDCLVVLACRDGTYRTVRDERLSDVDQVSLEEMRRLLDEGRSVDEALEGIQELLRAGRAGMNSGGLYWSVADNPEAGLQMVVERFDAAAVRGLLLCSDGFSRLWDPFGLTPEPAGLLRMAEQGGLAKLGRRLREIESEDDSMRRYPRFARHDDATAILLRAAR